MSVARWQQLRLLFGSFEGWTKDCIGQDILAGLTLTAITVPEQMATAGFEPQIGFYAFIGATIGFVALGASRVLTPGRTDARLSASCRGVNALRLSSHLNSASPATLAKLNIFATRGKVSRTYYIGLRANFPASVSAPQRKMDGYSNPCLLSQL